MNILSLEYKQGRLAFQEGRERDSNPYDYGSRCWRDWDDGWVTADDDL